MSVTVLKDAIADVSRWQGNIEIDDLPDSLLAVVQKVSEGLDWVDQSATKTRRKLLLAKGILPMYYHFGRPQNGRTGAQEAEHFLRCLHRLGWDPDVDGPLALDLEASATTQAATATFVRSFIARILKEMGDYDQTQSSWLYTSPGVWSNLAGKQDVSNCKARLWIAHYGVSKPTLIPGYRECIAHQYTSTGHVSGITGNCDLNNFYGTKDDLKKLAGKYRKIEKVAPDPKTPKKDRDKQNRAVKKAAAAEKARLAAQKKANRNDTDSPHYPDWLPQEYQGYWDKPWELKARNKGKFSALLLEHGKLTPNFSIGEAKCKDGTVLPKDLWADAQKHAWRLEMLRHALGDLPLPILSWWRYRAYNQRIGGAPESKHIYAIATDHTTQWVSAMGRAKVQDLANRIWADGGVGTYPAGSMHFDTRGTRARWTSF